MQGSIIMPDKWNIGATREVLAEAYHTHASTFWMVLMDAHLIREQHIDTLLKTIEEPPIGVCISLVSPDISQLKATVRSRLIDAAWTAPDITDWTYFLDYHGVPVMTKPYILDYAMTHPLRFIEQWRDGSAQRILDVHELWTQVYRGDIGGHDAFETIQKLGVEPFIHASMTFLYHLQRLQLGASYPYLDYCKDFWSSSIVVSFMHDLGSWGGRLESMQRAEHYMEWMCLSEKIHGAYESSQKV